MARSVKPAAFSYPVGAHSRRHGPAGWKNYSKYRPWLRDEFSFRCVYCLIREQWVDMRRGYQIDHFIPQKIRPDLKADYNNLLYLCPACNSLKGSALLPDPCKIALSECLEYRQDGTVIAINKDGEFIIEVLELDSPQLIGWRRRQIETIEIHKEHKPLLFKEEMGFPVDLPDLSSENPPENSRPEGIDESWFSKRERGELPEIY